MLSESGDRPAAPKTSQEGESLVGDREEQERQDRLAYLLNLQSLEKHRLLIGTRRLEELTGLTLDDLAGLLRSKLSQGSEPVQQVSDSEITLGGGL